MSWPSNNLLQIIDKILSRSILSGFVLTITGLVFSFIMRFHLLFVFVPKQIKQSGGFWDYFTGSGEYGWYLTDPVGLILFLSCLLPAILGLAIIYGGSYFQEKISKRITKEEVDNYLRNMNIKKK